MSETIKAKTNQRLSSSRRVSCPLRGVSLSALRGTIVPLLLVLLAVLADASYPSILSPKPLCVPIVEKNKKEAPHGITAFLPPPPHPSSKGSWHPKVLQGTPLMRRLRIAASLMPTAPYTEFSCVSTTRSICGRTYP